MRKNLTLMIICIAMVTLTACFGKSPKTTEEAMAEDYENFLESYTEDGKSKCILQLTTDRTSFYVGEDSKVVFSVVIPAERMAAFGLTAEDFDKDIAITDLEGDELTAIPSEALSVDGNGNVTGSIRVQLRTENSGYQAFQAKFGEYTSAQVALYVTPHITEDQIEESLDAGSDLTAYLEKNYTSEDSDETLAKAAAKFLNKDKRIDQVKIVGTSVYFNTTSGIANVFHAEATDPEMLSSGGTADDPQTDTSEVGSDQANTSRQIFETNTKTTRLYRQYGDNNSVQTANGPVYLDAGNTTTNGNVLILRPATNAMVDPDNYQMSFAANKINKITDSTVKTEKKDDEAVKAIMSGEMANYGTVILQCHGGPLYKTVDGAQKQCGVSFTMFQDKSFSEKKITKVLAKKLRDYAEMEYKLRFGEGTENEVNDFYSNFYGTAGEPDSWRLYFAYERDGYGISELRFVGEIQMTSGYIMERYASTSFDNTVMYIGACYGMSYTQFERWLFSHGCQLVLGYLKTVNIHMSLQDFNDFFDQLTKTIDGSGWRTKTTQEACINDENRFINLLENISQEGLRKISEWVGASTIMSCLGNVNFFYRGDGKLEGRVYFHYPSEDGGQNMDLPCEAATVTPHLFKNQAFEAKNEASTDAYGSFSFDDMRCGVYAIEVSNDMDQHDVVSIVFDKEILNGGKIYLPGLSLCGKVINKQTGEPIEGAEVILTGCRDGKPYKAETDANGLWKCTYATQRYNIIISHEYYNSASHDDVLPNAENTPIITEMSAMTSSGVVVDSANEKPIPGVSIEYTDPEDPSVTLYATSDENGEFILTNLKEGSYSIHFSHSDYSDTTVKKQFYSKSTSNDLGTVYMDSNLTMEGIGLSYGHYDGIKPQGDGAIPCEIDLNEDGTFYLYCHFDLFSMDSTPHSYRGTYTVDRLNENGDAVLAFDSDSEDFEMIWDGKSLYHDNFFFFVD